MNYGWKCEGWSYEEKWKFAILLHKEFKIPIGNKYNDGINPYIEIDGAYGGVRIRRITHLSEKEQEDLVKKADEIYKQGWS